MPSSDPSRSWQHHLEDHREIHRLVEEIGRALAERSKSIDQISHDLAQLADRLLKHFADEEHGGYLTAALEHAPRLFERANALMAQHPLMSRQARELTTVTAQAAFGADEPWWEETLRRFLEFKAELFEHERRENELLLEAYHRDLGDTD